MTLTEALCTPRSPSRRLNKGLTREIGTRKLGLLVEKSTRALVANERHLLALNTMKSTRQLGSSFSSQGRLDDSLRSLDYDTLHFLCKEAAELLGYDTTQPDNQGTTERHITETSQACLWSLPILEGSEENQSSDEFSIKSANEDPKTKYADDDGVQLVEVERGISIPFYGSEVTEKAIRHGSITVTTCSRCMHDMVCIDHVYFAVCPDCLSYSPVAKGDTMDTMYQDMTNKSIGLGVKGEMLQLIVASIDNPGSARSK